MIVGGVAAGGSAAARARRMDESASIVLFERDDFVSFANCGLPYYVGGEIQKRGSLLLVTPSRFHKRFRIDVRVRHGVRSIDRERKLVRVKDLQHDREFDEPYDKLILAPGASPIIPETEGDLPDNVFVLRNIRDVDRIKGAVTGKAALKPRRSGAAVQVAVVGSGFIGLEMVEQLQRLGLEVTLVEMADQILPVADPEMAAVLEKELWSQRVEVVTEEKVVGFEQSGGKVSGVVMESGDRVDADLVILGLGTRPNVELASAAGIALGDSSGIAVNEFQQTNDPDIYAAGDVAEYIYAPTGKCLRVPLAGPANRSGRIAGEHAVTGQCTVPMAPVLGTTVVRVFGQTFAMTGLSEQQARCVGQDVTSVVVCHNDHAGYYPGAQELFLKLVYEPGTGKLLGAQAVGPKGVDKRIDVISTALRFGGTVRDLQGVDLAYAPPFGAAKDPVHMAAFAACNQLDGLVEFVPAGANLRDVQVVDVRTAGEVQKEPVPGGRHAIHIPLEEFRGRMGELDPTRRTIVVCRSGPRSYVAVRILMQNGFSDVANLTGGVRLRHYAVAG